VLVTSGPLAGDDDTPLVVETVTQAATNVPTTVPTPEPTGTATAAPTPGQVDAEGWPVIECPAETEPVRSPSRKITLCAPVGDFKFTPYERDEEWERLHALAWYHNTLQGYFLSVQVISREGSPYSRDSYQADCKTDEPTGTAESSLATLLGYGAEQCIWRSTIPGKIVIGNQEWGIEQFVELPDYWIIANATGPQTGAEADAALELALKVFASATAASLERQP
jgi:hypothetical protein